MFTPTPSVFCAGDHAEEPLLRELLDEAPILRQEPGVVEPDPVREDPPHLLAVGRVEARVRELRADRLAVVGARDLRAREPARDFGGLSLGEVHDVDGRLSGVEELLDGLVQRRLPVREVERHRALVAVHVRELAAGERDDALLDRRGVADRRGHQQELRAFEHEERHLPGECPRSRSA